MRVAQAAWATYRPNCTWATLGHSCVNHPKTRINRAFCWPKAQWATLNRPWPGPHTPLGVGRWATRADIG
jgi:hypothetical protein